MTNDWKFEALVFSTNFRMGFDVEEFQTILPKNLIHHVVQGEPIFDFFEAWKQAAKETSAMKTYGRKTMVHRRGGVPGADGIQGQCEQEVSIEGVSGVGERIYTLRTVC